MIYSYESIRAVHLELTDRCNAACPMCPRYVNGEEAPHIQNVQFYLDDIKSMLPIEFVRQINRVNFCGDYGDPIVARDLLPIIKYFRHVNDNMRVEVNTNGSARREDWWRELASIMGSNEATSGVWFGLDGLADTNHLYRRNTNWEVTMRNAKAFIDAGGIAHWNFIVFKHNEHQIDEAQALAKEMGFKHFNIKLTARFLRNDTFPVFVKGEHAYDLEPPTKEGHQFPTAINHNQPRPPIEKPSRAMMDVAKIIEEYRKKGHSELPVQVVPRPNIECIARKEESIYVSARGLVYPCCWIGDGHTRLEEDIIINDDNIDITKHSIEEIVTGGEFQMIEDSWNIGSIRKCVNICSVIESDKTQYGPELVIHKRADEK